MDFTGCRLPYSSGSSGSESGGVCELRMGWVRPLFRHRKYKVPADSKLFENSLFSPIFYRWIAVGAPGRCVSALTDEGMVTVF